MRLDFFGKNHKLNLPCPTCGNNMSSERSAAHHCIHSSRESNILSVEDSPAKIKGTGGEEMQALH